MNRSIQQQTLRIPFTVEGVGIHTGARGRVRVEPAPPSTGRVFLVGGVQIPARVEFVIDTTRSTTLGRDGVRLSTVEHLLSALAGCGVDNARIEAEGPEIPILDGSAAPFARAILDAGLETQGEPARVIRLTEPLLLDQGASFLEAAPAEAFTIAVTTEFEEWPQGQATLHAAAHGAVDNYSETIAPARTFAFRREVDMLLAAGLARGGSLDNALIISPPDQFSTPLRVPLEWCAHKMLDLIGDLALLDARPEMRVTAHRPGHRLNTEFARLVRKHGQEQPLRSDYE